MLLIVTTNSYAAYVSGLRLSRSQTITFSPTLSSVYTTEYSKKGSRASLNRFVADNLNNLAIDIAKGSGEYIEALAEIKQITKDDKEIFFANLKSNFDNIFPSSEVDHKYVVDKINKISGA